MVNKIEPGDAVYAIDQFGAGGNFSGILLNLTPVFSESGRFLGNTAEVLDTTFEKGMIKTAVSWQKDTSVSREKSMEILRDRNIKLPCGG